MKKLLLFLMLIPFLGLTQSVNTTFGGSGATSTDRTYSWWMKATETAVNKGVFGYGSDKREAFLINHSQNAMGKPIIRLANHMYKYFMTPGHEEDGGGLQTIRSILQRSGKIYKHVKSHFYYKIDTTLCAIYSLPLKRVFNQTPELKNAFFI